MAHIKTYNSLKKQSKDHKSQDHQEIWKDLLQYHWEDGELRWVETFDEWQALEEKVNHGYLEQFGDSNSIWTRSHAQELRTYSAWGYIAAINDKCDKP